MARNLYDNPKFALAKTWFVDACIISQYYDASLRAALTQYGDHGAHVSGAGRDHFPEEVKRELRALARRVTEASNTAWGYKPSRVRNATMRELARQCAVQHGFGFYGPQGNSCD